MSHEARKDWGFADESLDQAKGKRGFVNFAYRNKPSINIKANVSTRSVMSNVIISLAEPVQQSLIIGSGVISIIVGFWAMLKGRGCDTAHEYYGQGV
jgi:hypothetical protein